MTWSHLKGLDDSGFVCNVLDTSNESSGIRVATRVPVRSADEALVGSDHSLAADVQGNKG